MQTTEHLLEFDQIYSFTPWPRELTTAEGCRAFPPENAF